MSEYVGKIKDLPEAPGNFIENASKKVVFGPLHFWSDYVMRCFDLKPGAGEKEPHTHPWPHWVVIYDGEGVFSIDGVEIRCPVEDTVKNGTEIAKSVVDVEK